MTKNEAAFQFLLRKFSKACIAEMCGVSRQAITKWRTIPGPRVKKLAAATRLPAEKIRPDPLADD